MRLRGEVTAFVVDSLGLPVMTNVYDTIGRKTSETDLAGLTTRFEYDGVGNLTAVIDALSQRTEYGYDDAHGLLALLAPDENLCLTFSEARWCC